MEQATGISGLRLVRIVAESVLQEKVLPAGRPNKHMVGMIARQLGSLVDQMEEEWENDPSSAELRDAFVLLDSYLECLKSYTDGRAETL